MPQNTQSINYQTKMNLINNLLANTNASKNKFFILSPKILFLLAFGL